jgi:hypothetical protein
MKGRLGVGVVYEQIVVLDRLCVDISIKVFMIDMYCTRIMPLVYKRTSVV